MKELAVIPECYVDTCLAEAITRATVNHQKGCNTVSKLMQGKYKDKFALGIVDKDKKPLSYLGEFELLASKDSLYLYKHPQKPHYMIQISPAIEEFILKAAKEKNISLSDYGLSDNMEELKRKTKKETSKKNPIFTRLFKALSGTSEFTTLKALITYIATEKYGCNTDELKSKLS
jgi:hypothetical protein